MYIIVCNIYICILYVCNIYVYYNVQCLVLFTISPKLKPPDGVADDVDPKLNPLDDEVDENDDVARVCGVACDVPNIGVAVLCPNAVDASCLVGLNAKLAVFVGALELIPNVLPNTLLLCEVVALLPNVKSDFVPDPVALVFAVKLNPLLADCCDDEPNVNNDGFDAGLVVSLGLVDENNIGVVVVSPKVAVLLFPKAGVFDEPKSEGVALDGVPKFERGFFTDVCVGGLNPVNFVASGIPKIDDLVSMLLLPNAGILFSDMANPDDDLFAAMNVDGLSIPNAVVVFDSLLLNNDVELEITGKVPVNVVLTDLLGNEVLGNEDASGILFSPNNFVDSVADDIGIWPKVCIVAGWDTVFELGNVKED
jgi:hypothetical protein